MPTYEYVCKNCGENFEVFQSFSDKPLKKHKVCGGDLQKVFHARGIVFKGGGFYATDSKAASTKTASESGNGDKSGKPGKPEKKASAKAVSSPASSSSSDSD
ncbi:MAG TPA: FmdB family zinc ribbon protein [Acidimicrobiia bacterium]